MKHTPTPYFVRHHSDDETLVVLTPARARPGRFVARVFNMDPEQRRVDAEFIATACNNHDALVGAVNALLIEVGDKGRPNVRREAIQLLKAIAK